MQEHDSSTRFAGFAIAVTALTLVVNISLFAAFFGRVPAADEAGGPTPVERAEHLTENWSALSTLWFIEVGVYLVLAVSALALVTETRGGVSWCPRRIAWSAVALGAIIQVAMYAYMLGGYAAAISVVAAEPGLVDAMYRSALVLFFAGNVAMFFGFGAVFASEIKHARLLNRRVAWVGSIVCVGVAVLMLAVVVTGVPFVVAAPPALVAHFFLAYLGFRIGTRATAA